MIVSEQPASPGGELPLHTPQPYEDPQSAATRRRQLNSLTTGHTHFENLTYESEDEPLSASSVPRQTTSFMLNSEEYSDERLYSEIDAPCVDENEEIYESIDDNYIQSPPAHIKAMYSVINKNSLVCSMNQQALGYHALYYISYKPCCMYFFYSHAAKAIHCSSKREQALRALL